ncbi:MAG: DNA mismatch repair protein [Polyangiaceae bacterium]
MAKTPTAATAASDSRTVADAAERPAAIPDLLHPQPLTRVDLPVLKEALTFAFASGVSGGLFVGALEKASVGISTWEPSAFVKDLFVEDFVARCFKVKTGPNDHVACRSHLVRLLCHPPSDPAVVAFRREICAELAESTQYRGELERIYATICRFRGMLEGATGGKRWDANRRQLDILAIGKEIFERMAGSFAGARSGLARLRETGAALLATEAYRSLRDLLDFDDHLATLRLEVSVGADGRVRNFSILKVEENAKNPMVVSPLRRMLTKVELLARGYKFGDGEVMARLLDAVFEGLEDWFVLLFQLAGDLEFYLGALGFRDMARAAGLEACLPTLVGPRDGPRVVRGLFNPLLVAHGTRAVPCEVRTDRFDTTLIVTGPNSGGKTRLLQSLGLTQMLAQAGVFVPAAEANLAPVPAMVVSLIQETTADQAEGRLGMELLRIRALFERLPQAAMVVLDELCSGTNPSEGEEIFELVVSLLIELRPQAFITTHFLSFAQRLESREKAFALSPQGSESPGAPHTPSDPHPRSLEQQGRLEPLRFLQVELDEEQRPTYQFVPGVARTSLAERAAARLGVTRDQLRALVERSTARALTGADGNGSPS